MSLDRLRQAGYDVRVENHAAGVLAADFPEFLALLTDILANFHIPDREIIEKGGNRGPMTRRLAERFDRCGWEKRVVTIEKRANGETLSAPTHEMDHLCETASGRVAVEIEWNNKDTFFDRDLSNFRRLHSEGWLSAGVIVTRGHTLHGKAIRRLIGRFSDRHHPDLSEPERKEWVTAKAGKFSATTTHWNALKTRLDRGEGSPCPMLLLGIPAEMVTAT